MIFIERAALQQQPPGPVEHKHRKSAVTDALPMGGHLLDNADFLIVFVDAHEHRSGHWRLIYTRLRSEVAWHAIDVDPVQRLVKQYTTPTLLTRVV